MKQEWDTEKLGDICEIYQPKTISKKEMVVDGEYPVFGANGIIGRYNQFNHEDAELLVTCRGATCGAVNISLPKSWINGNAMVIKPKITNLDRTFLEYYFRGVVDYSQIISGAAQPQITRQSLSPVEISFPPISEQKRIVAILDKAFAGISQAVANAEKNLANARELFESYLNNVFTQKGDGWMEKTLKDISLEFGRGKSKHRPRNDKSLYDGDYPFIQTGDVRNCEHIITSYSKTYNEKGLAQSKLWPKGTICITIAANIAETGILDFESCFPDSIIGVVVNPAITKVKFVEYLLQSFKSLLQAKGKGSAQDNINMGTFESQKFPFPTLEKQDSIVATLDALLNSIQKLELIYRKKLATLAELKQSILQKAFAGELH